MHKTTAVYRQYCERERLPLPAPPLCLGCVTEFYHDKPPPVFFVLEYCIGIGGRPRKVILSGICRKHEACSDDELLRIGVAGLRKRWPDIFGEFLIRNEIDESGHESLPILPI